MSFQKCMIIEKNPLASITFLTYIYHIQTYRVSQKVSRKEVDKNEASVFDTTVCRICLSKCLFADNVPTTIFRCKWYKDKSFKTFSVINFSFKTYLLRNIIQFCWCSCFLFVYSRLIMQNAVSLTHQLQTWENWYVNIFILLIDFSAFTDKILSGLLKICFIHSNAINKDISSKFNVNVCYLLTCMLFLHILSHSYHKQCK